MASSSKSYISGRLVDVSGIRLTLDTRIRRHHNSASMNLLRIGHNSGVAALTPDVSVVSILGLLLSVLLLGLGLLLRSTLAAG